MYNIYGRIVFRNMQHLWRYFPYIFPYMENIIPCMEVFPYIFSYMENTGSIKFEYITFDLDVWKFLSTWKYL